LAVEAITADGEDSAVSEDSAADDWAGAKAGAGELTVFTTSTTTAGSRDDWGRWWDTEVLALEAITADGEDGAGSRVTYPVM
jgi:hypothetical protein